MVLVVPEQSQRPYRFGMTLLCVGALFNWLGLADTYSEPVPAIRYIGVGLIAAGASLICMAMCFWMRNIHDPNNEFDVPSNPVHVITIDPSLEKPPDYSTVVDVPPCYEDAIKLNNSASKVVAVHTLKHVTTASAVAASIEAASNDLSGKSASAERDHSSQPDDSPDFATQSPPSTDVCQIVNEKSDAETSHNSSQSENALAKVLRKSIRGIRKLRSGGDDVAVGSPSSGQGSAPENVLADRVIATTEATGKCDR